MTIDVRVPRVLRGHTGGQAVVPIEATTISDLMEGLFEKFPTLRASLAGEDADVMAYTNVYINDVEASEIGGLEASLSCGDTVTILPSMAGGLPVQSSDTKPTQVDQLYHWYRF